MMAFSDSLFGFKGRPVAQSYVRPWLGRRYIPEHPGMRTWLRSLGASPTKCLVIDPVPQHDVKADGQLARDGDFGNCRTLAKRQAPPRHTAGERCPGGEQCACYARWAMISCGSEGRQT